MSHMPSCFLLGTCFWVIPQFPLALSGTAQASARLDRELQHLLLLFLGGFLSSHLYFLLILVNAHLESSLLVATAYYCLSSDLSHFFESLPHDPLGAGQRLWKKETADCLSYFLLSHQELTLECGGKGPAQLAINHGDTCHCPNSAGCVFQGKKDLPLAVGNSSHPAF